MSDKDLDRHDTDPPVGGQEAYEEWIAAMESQFETGESEAPNVLG